MERVDNNGFTLVELIISTAISVIVIAAIAFFMGNSSRNYRNASDEIMLQIEAQTIINQLNDLVMESHNVKFSGDKLKIDHNDGQYIITYDTVNHRLMFEKVLTGEVETGNSKLFGQYVVNFQVVDTGVNNQNNKIQISLELEKDGKTYSIQNNTVTIRNRIK